MSEVVQNKRLKPLSTNEGEVTPLNGGIVVEFEKLETPLGLAVPERYTIQEGDHNTNTAVGVTTDRRLINPQIVKVVTGNSYWLNFVKNNYPEHERKQVLDSQPPINDGERYFVHYGAYEVAKWYTETRSVIPGHMFFLKLDPMRTLPGYYLGEEIITEGEKTASGIYTTPYAEKKEGVLIKITHVPANSNIKPGDTVVTIDHYQYPFLHEGKNYIRLREREIIGIKTDSGFMPIGDKIMVKYIHDPKMDEIVAENERRIEQQKMVFKYNMSLGAGEKIELLPEPSAVEAEVLAFGQGVKNWPLTAKKMLVRRNFGCILPYGNWIISDELVLWAYGSEKI